MVIRSREEWLELFSEHARSGMTARAFCGARGLCPKHFSLRRKQLGWPRKEDPASAFVRVEKAAPREAPKVRGAEPRVLLRLGRCVWELQGVPVDELARLMGALA